MNLDAVPSREDRRELLQADCGNCYGLCCAALAFSRSADFAIDKDAGEPCVNLQPDFACGIHERLRSSGFRGCTVFDCFGAGQKVAQQTFGGRSWVEVRESRQRMFAVFPVMRELHELLWYLSEAIDMSKARDMRPEVVEAFDAVSALTESPPDVLMAFDLNGFRDRIVALLTRVSDMARSDVPRAAASRISRKARPGADLMGADLAGQDLRGVNLRGAYLIAADLAGADLRWTDLIGADLRDADLTGADLSETLFLTQPQLNSAKGDASTRLPRSLALPTHWAA